MNDRRLSIVIPVFDEVEHLADSLAIIRREAAGCVSDLEIVVVDDGSRDGTGDLLDGLVDTTPSLRVIHFTRNFGKEAALHAGLEAATGAAVITMDADLQHPPSQIRKMVAAWGRGDAKVVNAVKRRGGGGPRDLGARLYYRLLRGLSGTDLDRASDFKLLDRSVVDQVLALPERGRLYRGLIAWLDQPATEVTFEVPERVAGRSHWSLRDLLGLSVDGITAFSAAPLQIVTILGVIFLAAAVILGSHTLWRWSTGGAAEGFPTVIILLLLVGSILMMALGIIGQYIARIYDELKGRPAYIIRNEKAAEDLRDACDGAPRTAPPARGSDNGG